MFCAKSPLPSARSRRRSCTVWQRKSTSFSWRRSGSGCCRCTTGGCKAESVQTIGQELERNARIVGTKGSIFLPDFQHAETMKLEEKGKEPEVIRCPVDINGFEYEIREASRCVKLGRTGSDRYTPQDSLALTRLMYDTRMSWGMKFAGEV